MTQATKQKKNKPKHKGPEAAAIGHDEPAVLRELVRGLTPTAAHEVRAYWRAETTASTNDLSSIWERGRRVHNLRLPENEMGEKGEPINAVDRLARAANRSERTLNRWAQLYRAFVGDAGRARLVSLRMAKTGQPLTFAHFEHLLKKWQDKDPRNVEFNRWLDKTVKMGWTADELDAALQNERPAGEEPRGGGRPVSIPATFHGKATKLVDQLSPLLAASKVIYLAPEHSFHSAIRAMSQEQIAKEADTLLADTERMRAHVRAAADLFARLDLELRDVHAYVQQHAAEKVAGDGRSEADALDAADADHVKNGHAKA